MGNQPAATCLENIIPGDFSGTLQSDGYQAYRSFARSRGEVIVLAGCMAHVRRKFYEARNKRQRWRVGSCGKCRTYTQLNPNCGRREPVPNLRAAIRGSQSRMMMNRLHRALIRVEDKPPVPAPKPDGQLPLTMPSANGPPFWCTWTMGGWRSTII